MTADICECPPYVNPAPGEVDVADAQGGCLAPAQAGVCQHQHERSPRAGLARQFVDLVMSQEDVVAALDSGQA